MKILVIRVGRAGDMVMVTPAITALLKLYPDAEIHMLTSPDGERVFKEYDPRLKEIIIYDRRIIFGHFVRRKLAERILKENYFRIYCFELNPGYQKLFNRSLAKTYSIEHKHEKLNYSERCLRVVKRSQDRSIKNEWVNLPVSDAGREKAEILFMGAEIQESDYVIALHPSFSGLRKEFFRSKKENYLRQWPADSFAKLAILLTEHAKKVGLELKIIMDLLPDERELGEKIVSASGNRVILLIPKPDFERYKAVIQRANLLVTPNTGPMHIGGAVGASMVALFSGMSPEDCGPYVPKEQYIALCAEDTDRPELGIASISHVKVFEACREFLPK